MNWFRRFRFLFGGLFLVSVIGMLTIGRGQIIWYVLAMVSLLAFGIFGFEIELRHHNPHHFKPKPQETGLDYTFQETEEEDEPDDVA